MSTFVSHFLHFGLNFLCDWKVSDEASQPILIKSDLHLTWFLYADREDSDQPVCPHQAAIPTQFLGLQKRIWIIINIGIYQTAENSVNVKTDLQLHFMHKLCIRFKFVS